MIATALAINFLLAGGSIQRPPSQTTPIRPQFTPGGNYRFIIEGFKVEHEFRDGALDAGDSIFVNCMMTHYQSTSMSPVMMVETPVVGGNIDRRVGIRAGTKTRDGGFQKQDQLPSDLLTATHNPSLPGHFPVYPTVFDTLRLVQGADALLFIPTIWHVDAVDRGSMYGPLISFLKARNQAAYHWVHQKLTGELGDPFIFWSQSLSGNTSGLGTFRDVYKAAEPKMDSPYGRLVQGEPGTQSFSPIAIVFTPKLLDDIIAGRRTTLHDTTQCGIVHPGLLYFRYSDRKHNGDVSGDVILYIRIDHG